MNQLKHLNHSVGQNTFHLVWKTKYSYDPFKFPSVRAVVIAAIKNATFRSDIKIIEMEVMPDHVHCFVDLPTTIDISRAFQMIKGFSSRMVFRHHPWLRKYFHKGHFWSPGKFFRSVGSVTAEAIQKYISESNRSSRQQASLERYLAL